MNELLTTAEMAQADRLAIAGGIAGIELMENAGRAVAESAAHNYPSGTRFVVVAGPGNNGGDGYVAARLLAGRGAEVRVLRFGGAPKGSQDAAQAARRWTGPIEDASPQGLADADVIIDALFGAGLDRPVQGEAGALIAAINRAGKPVIAVDVPSGIDGTTGAVLGAAVTATETVTFFRRKIGHLLLPGRLHCGALHLADIGIPDAVLDKIKPQAFLNAPALWRRAFPVPRPDGHKYHRGHAVVVGGGMPRIGAAKLAARGALRAGAGLVTIASPRDALRVQAASNMAVMVEPVQGAAQLAALLKDVRRNAVVLGPGGGVGGPMRQLVRTVLGAGRAVVLDADAITSFAGQAKTLAKLIQGPKAGPSVLTPHQGEFRRLFKVKDKILKALSKLEESRLSARFLGANMVYKGADTVTAAPDGRASVAENASPWLATAGSGDVLAGMIGGLLAQGMPPFEAASAAVWLHGEAAHEFGPGLIAEDLPEMLPAVLRRLLAT